MQTAIVDNLKPDRIARQVTAQRSERFAQELVAQQARESTDAALTPARHAELREAAEQFVASALMLPLLAQVREDPFRSELFHGGSAEDAFQSQLDTILADRITRGSNLPLVDVIVEHVLNRYGQSPAKAGVDTHG